MAKSYYNVILGEKWVKNACFGGKITAKSHYGVILPL
jgi:hypothetical protein